jgi:hypothetical protein
MEVLHCDKLFKCSRQNCKNFRRIIEAIILYNSDYPEISVESIV